MNASQIERLLLRSGEEVTDAHIRALDAAIAQTTPLKSVTVRRRVLPWGTHEHYEGSGGSGGSYVSPFFQPSVTRSGGDFAVSWQQGLINGREPTIGGADDEDGDPISSGASYRVPAGLAAETGEILVYFRLALDPASWSILRIKPFASAATPSAAPWTADRLAVLIRADGSFWRPLVSNQGHEAVNRRGNGYAQHIFWGKF